MTDWLVRPPGLPSTLTDDTAVYVLVGVHRQSHRSSIVDPLNVTPRTHFVRIPCVVNAKCDTRSPIVVSFRPPRDPIFIDPHNQPRRKQQYCNMTADAALQHTALLQRLNDVGAVQVTGSFPTAS
jgi:hypothetical protein